MWKRRMGRKGVRPAYGEGDMFCVPLRTSGVCLGVIARLSKDRKIVLGYFFGEKLPSCPDAPPYSQPQNAFKVAMFGALSLRDGSWPTIGRVPDWNRQNWPVPKFIRRDPLSKRAWLVSYSDDDPSWLVGEEPCGFDSDAYETDSLWGAGFVEIVLTRHVDPLHAK